MELGVRKLASLAYCISCFAVCFYQTYFMFVEYLEYDVRTQLELKIPDPVPAPDLTVCIRYTDVIDLKKLGDKNNVTLERGYSGEIIRQIQDFATIGDIIKMTPREDSLVGECLFRKPKKSVLEEETGDLCMKFFTTSKFVTQEYVCYKFSSITHHNKFDYFALTSSLAWPGLFYKITFKNATWINDIGVMKMAAHSKAMLPFTSLALGSLVTSRLNNKNFNLATLTYKIIEISALESPYVTHCRRKLPNGQEYSKQTCYNDCIVNQTSEKYQKAPFSILIQEPLNLKQISSIEISNTNFSDSIAKIEESCNNQCFEVDCDYDYAVTFAAFQKSEELIFMVTAPCEPNLRITFLKNMTLNDLVYYSMSLFTFWFGISVLTFNPATWIQILIPKSSGRKQAPIRNNNDGPSKFCINTRKYLLREWRSELSYISNDIFLRK